MVIGYIGLISFILTQAIFINLGECSELFEPKQKSPHSSRLNVSGQMSQSFGNTHRPSQLSSHSVDTEQAVPKSVDASLNNIPGLVSLQTTLQTPTTALVQYRGLASEYFDVRWNGLPNLNFTGVQPAFEPRLLNREFSSQIRFVQGAESLKYSGGSLAGIIFLDKSENQIEKYRVSLGEYKSQNISFEKTFLIQSSNNKNNKLHIGGNSFTTNGMSQSRDLVQTTERDSQHSQSLSAIFETQMSEFDTKLVFNYSDQKQNDDLFLIDDFNAKSQVTSTQLGFAIDESQSSNHFFKKGLEFEASFYKSNYYDFSDTRSTNFFNSEFKGQLLTVRPHLRWQQNLNSKNEFYHQVGLHQDFESQHVQESSAVSPEFEVHKSIPQSAFFYIGQWYYQPDFLNQRLRTSYGIRSEPDFSKKNFLAMHFDLQYKMLFYRFSKSFKRPSFYHLYSKYGNRSLKSQTATLNEFGLKFVIDNEVNPIQHIEFKVFKINFSDLIIYNTNRFENLTHSLVEGFELIYQADFRNFYWHQNFVYSKSRDLNKMQILRRPDRVLKSQLGYKFVRSQIELEHIYLDEREDIDENFTRIKLSPMQNLDLSFEYQLFNNNSLEFTKESPFLLFMRINNLANNTREAVYGTPAPPRNVTLGLQYKN